MDSMGLDVVREAILKMRIAQNGVGIGTYSRSVEVVRKENT